MSESPKEVGGEHAITPPLKGGDAELIQFNYNDVLASAILEFERVRQIINIQLQRLRLIREQFSLLPEVYAHEIRKGKAAITKEAKTLVS